MEEIIKIVVSILLGAIVGIEREYHDKPAGFRTNIFICLGATIFTIVSLKMWELFNYDPGRIAAQIVTGVGFLGAGAILRYGNKIRGLTTASEVWLVASIGMAVGFGYYFTSLLAVIAVVFLQFFSKWFNFISKNLKKAEILTLRTKPNPNILKDIESLAKKHKLQITKKDFLKRDGAFSLIITVPSKRKTFDAFVEELALKEDILDLEN